MTKLILIRHGESLGNSAHVMLGHTDLDLSELGFKQAQRTGEELSGITLDAIYSSDLKRAMSTAEPHADCRGVSVIPNVKLREAHIGEWENLKKEEIIARYGDAYDLHWRRGFGTFAFPGGDGIQQRCDIFFLEVERIAKMHAGGTVMIVAHAAVIRAFWGRILGLTPEETSAKTDFPTNASYSTVEYINGVFVPGEYSVDAHLADVGITAVKFE